MQIVRLVWHAPGRPSVGRAQLATAAALLVIVQTQDLCGLPLPQQMHLLQQMTRCLPSCRHILLQALAKGRPDDGWPGIKDKQVGGMGWVVPTTVLLACTTGRWPGINQAGWCPCCCGASRCAVRVDPSRPQLLPCIRINLPTVDCRCRCGTTRPTSQACSTARGPRWAC